MLVRPNYNKLIKNTGSKYDLVIVAAKRASQIVESLSMARKGETPPYKPPMVDFIGKKPLTIALEEIAENKISFERTSNNKIK